MSATTPVASSGLLWAALACCLASCDRGGDRSPPGLNPSASVPAGSAPASGLTANEEPAKESPEAELARIGLRAADAKLCTCIVVLLDASSSMREDVPDAEGKKRPKQEIAREALERIVDITAAWTRAHDEAEVRMGLYQFSGSVLELSAPAPFDPARLREALGRVQPSTGTAIGGALEAAYRALYATGCLRKHIVCITDGQNSSGPEPAEVARRYHRATGGDVQVHFVAFDTSARSLRFLEEIQGSAVEAADGEELRARLNEIYERRILVEEPLEAGAAPPAAEAEPPSAPPLR